MPLCHPERAQSLPYRGLIVLQTIPLLRMPEGEAPHPRRGNPCGVYWEVNNEDGNPLGGHDLGCGGTEQLHWFCSPCIKNLWSCPLCWRPHPLCTAPPPRKTKDEDLTLHTLRTLIRQNVWNNGAGGDSPDIEWLDILTDKDLATPPPRPPWRAPTWALPDPGADPTIYVPDYEHYDDAPRGSLPPIGKLPDSWGPVSPHEPQQLLHHRRHPDHPPPDRLRLAGGGRRMGDWHRPRRPWRRVAGIFPPLRGHDPEGNREADRGLPHVEAHPPPRSLRPLAQRAQQPHVPPPQPGTYGNAAVARMMARGTRLLPPSGETRPSPPPHTGPAPRQRLGPQMYAPEHRRLQRPPRPAAHPPPPPPHPSPHHTNSAPPTPSWLRTLRHHRGPARHRAPDKSVRPNGRRNDNHRNTTRPQGSRDTGGHLPGAEPYTAPRIRGQWAPGPNNPLALHTRTGRRPRAPQEACNLKHHLARPRKVSGRQPARRQQHRPTQSPARTMAHLTGRQQAQHTRRPKAPPPQAHAATPTDTTTVPPCDTVLPHNHDPIEGLDPQAQATSSTEDLPATTHAGPAPQRHHAPPPGPTARPAEPSSPGRPAPGPDPGPDRARTTPPTGAPQPVGPGSRPEPPPVAEGHAPEAMQPTNDEAEPPALPTQPQRVEPTVDAEEMRGPRQRTATPTPMGEPGGGADRPAIQRADPPDIAAHGSGEALTAGQPDTEPEGPMPDTECEDGLHPPSATDRAGAARPANASTPGEAPPQNPQGTRAMSETREATPDTPQRAARRETSRSGHNRDDDSFDAFMESCMGDPHMVRKPAAHCVHPELRRDDAEDTPLTIPRQAHLQRDYTALEQVTAAGEGHAAASGAANRTTDKRGAQGGGARVEAATNTASEPTSPWGRGHLDYAPLEGDATPPVDQAEQAAARDLGLWIPRLTAGEQLALEVRIRWLLISQSRHLAEITLGHRTAHKPLATMDHPSQWNYVATRLMAHMGAYNTDEMNGLHWQWHQRAALRIRAIMQENNIWDIPGSPGYQGHASGHRQPRFQDVPEPPRQAACRNSPERPRGPPRGMGSTSGTYRSPLRPLAPQRGPGSPHTSEMQGGTPEQR